MRRLLLIAFLVVMSNFGQSQTTGAGFIIYVSSAPSGTCSAGAYQEDVIGLGTVYTCQSGTWTQVAGGGGSTAFSAITGATNSTAAMIIGTGASLTVSGSGTNTATGLTGSPAITVSSCTGCGGGALVQVETHTAASSAELDFTTCITSTYKTYKIVLRNIVPATNAVSLNMQFSSDGGATYLADSHYTSAAWRFNTGGGAAASVSNANQFRLDTNPGGATIDNTSTDGITGEYILSNPQSTSLNKKMVGLVTDMASGGSQEGASATYSWATSGTAANAFRILASSGNIATGTGTCYGLTP